MDVLTIVWSLLFFGVGFIFGKLAGGKRFWGGQLKVFFSKEEEKPIITAEFAVPPEELIKHRTVFFDIWKINLDSNENRIL